MMLIVPPTLKGDWWKSVCFLPQGLKVAPVSRIHIVWQGVLCGKVSCAAFMANIMRPAGSNCTAFDQIVAAISSSLSNFPPCTFSFAA